MFRCVTFGLLVTNILWGCGSSADDTPGSTTASGGSNVTTGGSGAMGIGGTSVGLGGHGGSGAVTGGTGGFSSGGTGAGLGGSGTAGATSTGDPDTSHCATTWPQSKVLPTIGPFFYGPDPGPCTSTNTSSTGAVTTTTYAYVGGHASSITSPTSTWTFTWDQGVLTGYTSTSSTQTTTGQYTWASDSLTDNASTGIVVKYVLSSTGYPVEAWAATDPSLSLVLVVRYEYSDCRLVRRVQVNDGTTVSIPYTSTFDYDAAGHISTQRYGDGSIITFDYSCW